MSESSRRTPAGAADSGVQVSPFRTLRGRDGARILASSSVFSDLDPGELQAVAADGTILRVRRGEVLTRHGEMVDSLVVIGSGRLKAVMPAADSLPGLMLGVFGPGDMIGEIGLFGDVPRIGSHIAVVDSTVLVLPKDVVLALADRRPPVLKKVLELVCRKFTLAADPGLWLRAYDLPLRFLRRLQHLVERDAVADGDGLRIHHGLSQQELADSIASSREALNRLMSDWKEAGLIDYGRGFIVVRDPARIAKLLPGSFP